MRVSIWNHVEWELLCGDSGLPRGNDLESEYLVL